MKFGIILCRNLARFSAEILTAFFQIICPDFLQEFSKTCCRNLARFLQKFGLIFCTSLAQFFELFLQKNCTQSDLCRKLCRVMHIRLCRKKFSAELCNNNYAEYNMQRAFVSITAEFDTMKHLWNFLPGWRPSDHRDWKYVTSRGSCSERDTTLGRGQPVLEPPDWTASPRITQTSG